MYGFLLEDRFKRQLSELDRKLQDRIITSLEFLAQHPWSHPHIVKIEGTRLPAFRMRVGRWRVLYFLLTDDHIIHVLDLFLKKSEADYRRRLKDLL